MPLTGTITVSTCGYNVSFGTPATTSAGTNTQFRARTFYLKNTGTGDIMFDVTTTSGCSTGYTLAAGTGEAQFNGLNGITGFSAIASTAAGSVTAVYLASR